MEWGGKLVGGALGFLLGGPVGAALGVIGGHLVDDRLGSTRNSKPPPPRKPARPARAAPERPGKIYHVEDTDPFAAQGSDAGSESDTDEGPSVENPEAVAEQFFQTTFEVMGYVAKSDGRVSESDIRAARAVMKDFALDDAQVARAIASFNVGKQTEYNTERAVMSLRRTCAGRPDLLRTFLEIQVRAAIGGSDLQGPSRPLLNRVAAMLGVGGLEFAQLETLLRIRYRARGNRGEAADWNRAADGSTTRESAQRQGSKRDSAGASQRQSSSGGARGPSTSGARMTLQEAYQVLGVLPGAPLPEITKAYRRQLSRHHPDKLKANGLPESMLNFAQMQTQLVIEAFNIIRESQGEAP
ncbi:MAG: co-chaperone DjlA [Gammaproteobacteria bacterium]|nr:co-chaperone DjlA [Gammaproteobacteria bacterium]MBM4210117.1 co-chaperone DjlA [Gammaproteobacteria bacterium]